MANLTNIAISKEPEPAADVRALVLNGLRAFNRLHAPAPGHTRYFMRRDLP